MHLARERPFQPGRAVRACVIYHPQITFRLLLAFTCVPMRSAAGATAAPSLAGLSAGRQRRAQASRSVRAMRGAPCRRPPHSVHDSYAPHLATSASAAVTSVQQAREAHAVRLRARRWLAAGGHVLRLKSVVATGNSLYAPPPTRAAGSTQAVVIPDELARIRAYVRWEEAGKPQNSSPQWQEVSRRPSGCPWTHS
jgi:hypothetical protein